MLEQFVHNTVVWLEVESEKFALPRNNALSLTMLAENTLSLLQIDFLSSNKRNQDLWICERNINAFRNKQPPWHSLEDGLKQL